MSLTIYSYSSISELSGIIAQIQKDNAKFIVPSRKDKLYFPSDISNNDLWIWEDIYGDICTSSHSKRKRVLSPPDHLLILKSILSEVLKECSEKVQEWPGLNRPGFSSVLSDDIHELLNEAVTPEQIPVNPESNEPSEFLLPEVYSRYLKYLEHYDLLDSAQIWTEALNSLKADQSWGRDLAIIFTGFLSFTHGQLELVQALQDRCREIIIIKPEANLSGFHDSSSQFGFKSEPHESSGAVYELTSSEPELEPEAIARTLALWSSGELKEMKEFPGFDGIGIMISQGREDSFSQALKRYGIPYDLTSGVRISNTLPGRVLSSIRNLNTRRFPTYETAMLLTQPCFAGVNFPIMTAYKAGRSGLVEWEEYLKSMTEDPETKSPEIFNSALLSIRAVKKFCESLSRLNTPERIMKAFYDFLTAKGLWLEREDKISGYPELDESIRLTASAVHTVETKLLALSELMPDLGRVQSDKIKDDEAFEFLESWCRNTNTRAPLQINNAVRIFTGQPPVLSAFPVWIMTSITAKSWSGNITSSPLLGNTEREKLTQNNAHLPTTQEKAAQREALFRRLIHTGEGITIISRPLLDDEGRPLSESPFMQRFFDDFNGWHKVNLKSESINILLGSDGFIFPSIDAVETNTRKAPVIFKKADSVGASDIHELLGCPFLWWQKRQANIYEQGSDIVSPVDWGIMLHLYWHKVWLRYSEDMNSSGQNFIDISQSEWKKLSHAEGDYGKHSRIIRDSRLKRKLESLEFRAKRLAEVQSKILNSLHDNGYEHKNILLETNAQLKYNLDGITFLGQCDRIEILTSPEGQEISFIADYKEGKSINSEKSMKIIPAKSWNIEEREKFNCGLQLSLYASLFKKLMQAKLSGVYVLGLEDGKIAGSFSNDTEKIFKPYQSSDDKNKHISSNILQRIDEGDYAMKCAVNILSEGSFTPEYNSDLCRLCSVKSICRKGECRGELITNNPDFDDE